jgi:hypothetical protein
MNFFLHKSQEELSLIRKYFYPCFFIKPIFGIFLLLLLLSATVGTANAQMEPKFEANNESKRPLGRPKNQLIPLDSLYNHYRRKMKYKGIYPSHSGIDVSKVRVLGTKFCDVEVDRDWIVFRDYISRNELMFDLLFQMKGAYNQKASKIWNPNAIKQIIYSSPKEGAFEMVAFVFEYGILGITIYRDGWMLDLYYHITKPEDGSKLFFDRVLLASTGDVVATTPTTYMIMGPDGIVIDSYDKLVKGDAPDLKNPTIREGKPGIAYITDEVMEGGRVRIILEGKSLRVETGVGE